MIVFKCKICGGSLEVQGNERVAECPYCGSMQTLPKLTNTTVNNLYDRANHFRRNNEFDKAIDLYEKILLEDTTDAETYWSLVLCKYGIEYVEDPQTKKRVPTIHRAQYTSILSDADYKLALQYADEQQKEIYQQEAAYIDEVQKGILEISLKEEPFDVFLCYKESDEEGNRTPDSALAAELYYELTEMGFKVFYSRITLEDKLGIAYEPYIFAALNSSKVMVVIGTKKEYLESVWVKNEWSRYLSLIKSGEKKLLIPAYKNMDPYELPEEFSHLQAQDMSRLGFMFDILHVIKKVVNITKNTEGIEVQEVPVKIEEKKDSKEPTRKEEKKKEKNVNVDALLERAYMFLEDEDWDEAEEYCEKVLDQQPRNAMAYVGKLLADLGVKRLSELGEYKHLFDENKNYQRAIQFGDEKLRKELKGQLEKVERRKREAKYQPLYEEAIRMMDEADDADELYKAKKQFEKISGYKEADIYAKKCKEEAKKLEREKTYKEAIDHLNNRTVKDLEEAIEGFASLKDYKDANEQLAYCKSIVDEVQYEEKKKQIKRRYLFLSLAIIAIILIAFTVYANQVLLPAQSYERAIAYMEQGNYDDAILIFESLGDYEESPTYIKEAIYRKAYTFIDNEQYEEGYQLLKSIGNSDAIKENKYDRACDYLEKEEYLEAFFLFAELENYRDVNEKIAECEEYGPFGTVAFCIENSSNHLLNAIEELPKDPKLMNAAMSLADAYTDRGQEHHAAYLYTYAYGNDLEANREIYAIDSLISKAKIGEIITFGTYQQAEDASEEPQPIEWVVLDVNDDYVLLFSTKMLEYMPYHEDMSTVEWESSAIRKWLNSTFYMSAFRDVEKYFIQNHVNDNYVYEDETNTNNVTEDFVSLLSYSEVEKYLTSSTNRFMKYDMKYGEPTELAKSKSSSDNRYKWWTRTLVNEQNDVIYVSHSVTWEYGRPQMESMGIRPAIWVKK